MSGEYFAELYAYDSTVNRQVLDLLRDTPQAPKRTRQIFAHLLAAKKVWMMRLQDQDFSVINLWPELSLDQCETLIEQNGHSYAHYLRGKTDRELDVEVVYKNSKGAEFHTCIRDILMHVLIHGGHHRGQIAMIVRESEGEPVNTDYITYIRAHKS